MELQTILQILYANSMENVVSLAVKLDNNISFEEKKEVLVQISKEELTKLGFKPKRDNYWINIPLPVVAYNKYKLDKQYLVNTPSGLKWVSDKAEDGESATPIEAIPKAEPEPIIVESTPGV